jgi:hypothetical protein
VIERSATAGGSAADELVLKGLPPGALRLEPCAAGLVVEAVAAGVRAGGHPLPPGGRRLLRPRERVTLHGAAIELAEEVPSPGDPTRVVAAALVRAAASGAPPIVGPHLVVLTGPMAGACFRLGPDQTLGRGRAADIRLPDPRASRRHARLRVEGREACIEDLGAKNGLRVNGVRVERSPSPLRPGDELEIGETVLALVAPGSGEPTPPQPATQDPPAGGPPRRKRPRPGPLAAAALLALSAAALALAGS